MLPDRIFKSRCVLSAHIPGNFEEIDRATSVASKLEPDIGRGMIRSIDQVGQVRVWDGRAQDELDVELWPGVLRPHSSIRVEADHDVRLFALGPNELKRIRLAFLHLSLHLLSRVTGLAGIAFDLPDGSQIFGGIEENFHIIELAHNGGMETKQSLHNNELARAHIFR